MKQLAQLLKELSKRRKAAESYTKSYTKPIATSAGEDRKNNNINYDIIITSHVNVTECFRKINKRFATIPMHSLEKCSSGAF